MKPGDRAADTIRIGIVCGLTAFLLAFCTRTFADDPPDIWWLVKFQHISDILRGPPLSFSTVEHEPTTDYLGTGATIAWDRVEVDITTGVKSRDCDYLGGGTCKGESGSELTVRWYPRRSRGQETNILEAIQDR